MADAVPSAAGPVGLLRLTCERLIVFDLRVADDRNADRLTQPAARVESQDLIQNLHVVAVERGRRDVGRIDADGDRRLGGLRDADGVVKKLVAAVAFGLRIVRGADRNLGDVIVDDRPAGHAHGQGDPRDGTTNVRHPGLAISIVDGDAP